MSFANWTTRFWEKAKSTAFFYKTAINSVVNYLIFPRPSCKNLTSLEGKTVIVTGGNSGIGFEITKKLYKQGARVIIASRNEKLTAEVAERIINDSSTEDIKGGEIFVARLNLCSLKSVMECAQNLLATEKNIHFLINNAGALARTKIITEDGVESMFATYLGHFLFTMLLLPKLMATEGTTRVINLTSITFKSTTRKQFDVKYENEQFDAYKAYVQCKLAIVLFTEQLNVRLKGKKVYVYSIHPGAVNTPLTQAYHTIELVGKLMRIVGDKVLLTPQEGAATVLRLVFKTDDTDSGAYYDEYGPSKSLNDEQLGQDLWELSWSLVNGKYSLEEFEKTMNL